MSDFHEDASQDVEQIQEMLEPLVTVVKQILDKIAAMDEEIDGLSKLVNEEIIGGITNLYNTKERMGKISGLKEKYGPMMDKYGDFYHEMTDNDLYEALYDELEELKSKTEGLDDAAVDAKVQELADMLQAKMDKMKGYATPANAEEANPATAVEVSIEKTTPVDDKAELVDKLRKMKAKSGEVKFN